MIINFFFNNKKEINKQNLCPHTQHLQLDPVIVDENGSRHHYHHHHYYGYNGHTVVVVVVVPE